MVSRINLTPNFIQYMRKLNNKKIRWIIQEVEKGSSISWVAQALDVTLCSNLAIGPFALKVKIEREVGKHIPHNRIYRIMLAGGKDHGLRGMDA